MRGRVGGIRLARQVKLPLEGDVCTSGTETESPVERQQLMEQVLERENILRGSWTIKTIC